MKRLTAIAATVGLAAALMATPPVAGGGAATVTVVDRSYEAVAGVPWPLELEVLQHGVQPIDWEHVSIVARQPSSGLVTAGNAQAADTVGRYLVDLVFPGAGDWTLEFGLYQLLLMNPDPFTVNVAPSASGSMGESSPISAAAPDCG